MFKSAPAFSLDKDIVSLGTATPGGGFPLYGAIFAEAINQTDPSLEVRTRDTKGSIENVPLLEAGKLDIALVQGEVALEAFFGVSRPPTNLKIIAAMYSTAGVLVVRSDTFYHSIKDLIGRPVVFGARGSGLVILAGYVLDGMGLDIDRDFEAIYVDRAIEGPMMVEEGRAAALWGGGIGWPGFVTVAKAKSGARFIAPDAHEINHILAKHTFLRRLTIPAGSYLGQDDPIHSVGSWSFVLARATLSEDVAYRLSCALHRSEVLMGRRLPQARETTMKNTAEVAPRLDLIHPGVLRYLREIGFVH
jgi:TRAP transporter TAXI family solute receptor